MKWTISVIPFDKNVCENELKKKNRREEKKNITRDINMIKMKMGARRGDRKIDETVSSEKNIRKGGRRRKFKAVPLSSYRYLAPRFIQREEGWWRRAVAVTKPGPALPFSRISRTKAVSRSK